MANAYVSTTGSAAYPGTVNAPTSLGTALSTAAAGDIVYLAPGVYRGTFTLTVSGTSGNVITFIGDTTNSLSWAGTSAGEVRITNYGSDTANPTAATNGTLEATSRNYVTFQNLVFECYGASLRSGAVYLTSCTYFTFTACSFKGVSAQGIRINTTTTSNITVNRCTGIITDAVFASLVFVQAVTSTNYDTAITLSSCLAIRCGLLWFDNGGNQGNTTAGGYRVINSTCIAGDYGIRSYTTNTTHTSSITNCFIMGITGSMLNGTTAVVTQTYNVYFAGLTNIATSVTSSAVGVIPINVGEVNMQGYGSVPIIAPYITSRLRAFGTATGAPATDLYNNAWSGVTPDAGGLTYAQQGNSAYLPSERNASTITIAPGSTSQSIELYLGATGLTASTAGLSAYYNRTRSADIQIPLVARTIGQAWTSGGFAEVNASTMPGVYRLDIPNEALASGADDVTVVVRGASGTNGAVMSIKLSSGGLTSAQTASAVWSENLSSYNTNNTAGRILKNTTALNPDVSGSTSNNITATTTTFSVDRNDATGTFENQTIVFTSGQLNGVSKAILSWTKVGSYAVVVVDSPLVVAPTNNTPFYILPQHVHSINEISEGVWSNDLTTHTTPVDAGGILAETHTLAVDIDSVVNQLPVDAYTQVFVGRFQLTQTGTTQGDIIEAFTTDTPSFELQLFDGDNNIVPVTGATLGLRILDVTSTVVETGTPTIEYGTGGIVRWTAPGSYVSIGCPAGMYRLFVDRTVSGTTTTFGPLQIKVQVQ